MSSQGSPFEGLIYISSRVYITGQLSLIAYTNTANSLNSSTVYADLTQPTAANGYAAILLDGTWSDSNGVNTYVHSTPTNPQWTASGTWSATVTGAAIVNASTSKILHFKDLTTPFVASLSKRLEIDLSTVVA